LLWSTSWPETHRDAPTSASRVLRLQVSTTTPSYLIWGREVVLGLEFRDSHLLGRCSAIWAMPSALFCFRYFSERVLSICPEPTQTKILLTMPPIQLGSQSCATIFSLLVEMGSC
jgi:hypothetical protein